MQLSKNFTLEDLTKSPTGIRLGIDNTPSWEEIQNLKALTENVLQRVRDHYGVPIKPNSGYRCKALNDAVGSKDSSQHRLGEAADIEVSGVSNYDLACWIKDNLDFDQVILEFYTPGEPTSGWVHVSFKRSGGNRKNTLTINKNGTQIGLIK